MCEVCLERPFVKRKFTQYLPTHQHASQDICKSCHEQQWVDSSGLCRECRPHPKRVTDWALVCEDCDKSTPSICVECNKPHDIILSKGKCVECEFGKDWHEYPKDTLRTSSCISCGRYLVLNEHHTCQICFINNKLSRSTADFVRGIHTCSNCDEYVGPSELLCSKHKDLDRKCADCGDNFVALSKHQWQCNACLPVCEACSEKFVPTHRTDDLCQSCIDVARKGECPKCGDPHEETINGICLSCQDEEYVDFSPNGEFTCWRCKTNKVSSLKEVCSVCRYTHFQCPSCLRQNLDYTEIVCYECKS